MAQIAEILGRDDAMDLAEADLIAEAVGGPEVDRFLSDVLRGFGGADTEAKLAAIIRGLLLAQRRG